MSGTSQSTPFVSGLASLLWSNFPNLNYHQIKKAIIQGATTPLSHQQRILNPISSYKIAKKMSNKNNDKTKK